MRGQRTLDRPKSLSKEKRHEFYKKEDPNKRQILLSILDFDHSQLSYFFQKDKACFVETARYLLEITVSHEEQESYDIFVVEYLSLLSDVDIIYHFLYEDIYVTQLPHAINNYLLERFKGKEIVFLNAAEQERPSLRSTVLHAAARANAKNLLLGLLEQT